MRSLAIALLAALSACTPEVAVFDPDAAMVDKYCEQYQSAPAPCYADSCEVGERVCGNEQVCQKWDDSGAFQCRTLYWCDCA